MSTTDAPAAVAAAQPHKGPDRRNLLLNALATRWRFVPVLLTLVLIWAVFTAQSPAFLSARNLTNLAEQIATMSIVALGLVLVLLIGEIDLSVATLSAVSGGIAGVLVVNQGVPLIPALLIGLAAGGLSGLIQGAIVMFLGAPAFIVTLGGQMVLQALLLVLLPKDSGLVPLAGTDLQFIAGSHLPAGLSYALATAAGAIVLLLSWSGHRQRVTAGLTSSPARALTFGIGITIASLALAALFNSYRGVPTPVAILAALLGLFSFVMTQTRYGTWIYAIGGNAEAARRSGIPVKRIKISAFVLLGMLTAVGGIVAASRVLGVSGASDDPSLLLQAIAAAVIGGTSLFGGRGNIWAALVGALVIGSIASGMFLINASTEARLFVQGAVLILAVAADALIARHSRAAGK